MSKNLVIVESPSKSKTIGKYLGDDYKVISSKGHIRDLATSGKFGLGVDVENGFTPSYVPIKGKSSIIKELKKDVKDSNLVYLASDPDREGEAIAWHLKDALGIKEDNYKRVRFNEITHDKVLEAMKNPSKIDDNLVKSQETRRILDRIIGFRLSKLLQRKIGAKSAGRVQSVALKLIVDREREIEAFKPEEYWTITAIFKDYEAELFKYKEEDIELHSKKEADAVLEKLSDKYTVESIEKKEKARKSKFPFITSTLQQESSTKLGFSAKKTMSIAQKLYEGIDLGDETVGLITYMRTDSIRLIMADASVNQTTIIFDNNNYKFKTVGSILIFDGYLKVYGDYESSEDKILPEIGDKEVAITNNVDCSQHFTKPPARYTEAKLIKTLEELGIGRPSTYATIIDTIKSRGYVELVEKKFKPTEIGIETTDKLQDYFSDLINTDYTKNMEDELDSIAEGGIVWNKVLQDFYDIFEPRVEKAFTDMEKKAPIKTGEMCPECGNPLVIRKGKYGEFVACSNYPDCKYIKKEEKADVVICNCPNCDGKIIEKNSRRGKTFYGCNNYPKCKTAYWDKPIDKKCPECGKMLVEKNGKIKCSECDYKE